MIFNERVIYVIRARAVSISCLGILTEVMRASCNTTEKSLIPISSYRHKL